jgi:SAM-dependent methyltransferase
VLINTRAAEIFEAINRTVNLVGADVLDLGCGYGDLAVFSLINGARHVTIVDKNVDMVLAAQEKIIQNAPDSVTWESLVVDIDDRSQLSALKYYHVGYCTSVLPYLQNRAMLLSFLAFRVETAIIEMQYYGDGPGPVGIQNDDDMLVWLLGFWADVEKIGQTYTGRSPAHRSIWKCSGGDGVSGWQKNLRPRLSQSI